MFDTMKELIDYATENNTTFAEIMIKHEMETRGMTREAVMDMMQQNLDTMREAVQKVRQGKGLKV